MTNIQLTEPYWLWLLILPLMLWVTGSNGKPGRKLRRFATPRLWPWLVQQQASTTRFRLIHRSLISLTACLAILALAGPYLSGNTADRDQLPVTDVVIVIDISASMATQDLQPNRLQRSKLALSGLLTKLDHHRVALIAFAANAYRLLPLTSDLNTVNHFITGLDTDMTRWQGSDLSRALALAHDTLKASPQGSRGMLLVTDGDTDDSNAALQQARRLAADDIPLFILGSATTTGGPVPGRQGRYIRSQDQIIISRLQETLLQQLATITNGRYLSLTSRDSSSISESLTQLARESMIAIPESSIPLYPWLIGISLILLLWLGQRQIRQGMMLTLLTACITALPQPGHAAPWQTQRAYQAMLQGNYQQAALLYRNDDSFQGRIGLGAASYRLQHYAAALQAFKQAHELAATTREQAIALYNLGNTQLVLGQYAQARNTYRQVLALDPMHKEAAHNLRLINDNELQGREKKTATAPQQTRQNDPQALNQTDRGQDSETTPRQKMAQVLNQWQLEQHSSGDPMLDTARRQLRGVGQSVQVILQQRIARQDNRADLPKPDKPW